MCHTDSVISKLCEQTADRRCFGLLPQEVPDTITEKHIVFFFFVPFRQEVWYEAHHSGSCAPSCLHYLKQCVCSWSSFLQVPHASCATHLGSCTVKRTWAVALWEMVASIIQRKTKASCHCPAADTAANKSDTTHQLFRINIIRTVYNNYKNMFSVQQSVAYLDVDSNDAKAQDLHHSGTSIPVGPSNTLHMHAGQVAKYSAGQQLLGSSGLSAGG